MCILLKMVKGIIIFCVTSLFIARTVSLPTVEKLRIYLDNELHILETLQTHIRLKEYHLQTLESQLEPLSAVVSGRGSRDEYLSNPLNTLTLVRRFTTDWLAPTNLMGQHFGFSKERKKWAGKKELEIVVRNMARGQMTYELSTDHLADGLLVKAAAHANITGADCYLMARYYYQQHQHEEAVQWLDQALAKHDNTVPRDWVLELKVLSCCFSGELKKSASTLSSLLGIFPEHKPSRSVLQDWHIMVNTGCLKAQEIMKEKKRKGLLMPESEAEAYNKLCQGMVKTERGLKCHYVHYNKHVLRLAPFRLEELQLDPPVVVFHDVINEGEIEEAKSIGYPQLMKSTVTAYNGSAFEHPSRTCEDTFVPVGRSKKLDNLTRRISHMTNLDTKFAETLQIVRYGLGGEFLFHGDYFGEKAKKYPGGDRMATIIFYISDPPIGGNTIFLRWQLSVKPRRGLALLWYNLKRDGSMDFTSLHAGCPVLWGTKWTLIMGLYELNNDFTTPCDVDRTKTHKYYYL